MTTEEATRRRSFDQQCQTHRWPLMSNGACSLCERDAESGRVVALCPPHATWSRDLKVKAFDRYLLAMVQTGTDDERRQRAWEKILDVAGRDLGIVHDYTTPAAETLARLTDHYHKER